MANRGLFEIYDAQHQGRVSAYMRKAHHDGTPLRQLAVELEDRFGITVHHTTVMRWMEKAGA